MSHERPVTTPSHERRITQVEMRQDQTSDSPSTLRGYAAVFNTETVIAGMFREQIAPGAFDGVLHDDCRALVNHNADLLIGRTAAGTCRLAVDSRGLSFDIDLPNTSLGRDIAELVKRGDLKECSFGFEVEQDAWTEPSHRSELPLRTITKLRRLWDISVVSFPAYDATTVSVRAKQEAESVVARAIEQDNEEQQVEADRGVSSVEIAAQIEMERLRLDIISK